MIIGLTGSIATGKSTVATMLKNKGYALVDADEIARQVVEPGRPVLSEITEVFGQEVLKADGSLDRERLGHRIFTNEEERKKLNAIMHPAVRKEMLRQKDEWLLNGARTVIMDIPLLFESKLQSFVEKVLVVSVSPSIQRARLMERNHLTEEEADARIRSQMPIAEKEELADAVIFNNGTREETEVQLTSILQQWGALA
ncbi:dephospho-CoA kinase [Sporosarcina saromensis]|uniref:Dephospho-CoA kinase n=1 Tax=Sporosarcina saromensis TaxID=359365 RepID=A0ABU4G7E4_9BACL|nr:dephospho-CoA kinase [Sporosarcina saromensis]MDW0112893.1 dephospho-CoA kinase [Sporosarcina saromensis]